MVKLKAFSKFENTTEALAAATALVESKLSKGVASAQGQSWQDTAAVYVCKGEGARASAAQVNRCHEARSWACCS